MSGWTESDIGDQTGRVAVVTGANSGIGYVTALELARRGAHVIAAARSEERGRPAVEGMRKEGLSGSVELALLDLADLSAIEDFADRFAAGHARLDLLINNAGVMMPPERQTTRDGFELQIGTNHFGHFALTGRLSERLLATPGSRVVTVSSMAHHRGRIDFDDLNCERKPYQRIQAYAQSKLANLLFMRELDRRLRAMHADAVSVAAHPGWTATDLQRHSVLFRFLNLFISQQPRQGAWPTLYAATADAVTGGDYVGPDGWQEMRGHPVKASLARAAEDAEAGARLWQISEEATGVVFPSS